MTENDIHTIDKKEQKAKRRQRTAAVFTLLANLVFFLTIWLLSKYDQISLDQVIFQMKTSAAGANSDLMNSAYLRVGAFGIVATLIEVGLYKWIKKNVC